MTAEAPDATSSWDAVLIKAGRDMCAALSLGEQAVTAQHGQLPAARLGSCIPLVGSIKVQLILLSTNSGVRTLAQRLVGADAGDQRLSGEDVADAFCELANQFAGLTKRGLSGHKGLRLGLPVFVRGTVTPTTGAEVHALDVRWDDVDLTLGMIISG